MFFSGILIQSTIELGCMYFIFCNLNQIPFPSNIIHEPLDSKAFEKENIFFNPHPLSSFGKANYFHFMQGMPFLSLALGDINLNLSLLSFSKNHFGTHKRYIYWIGISSRTSLTNTNLAPFDNYLKLH